MNTFGFVGHMISVLVIYFVFESSHRQYVNELTRLFQKVYLRNRQWLDLASRPWIADPQSKNSTGIQ